MISILKLNRKSKKYTVENILSDYQSYLSLQVKNVDDDFIFFGKGVITDREQIINLFLSLNKYIDICFLSDCTYEKIAPRYIQKIGIHSFVRTNDMCCMGSFYLSNKYAKVIGFLNNLDQANYRIRNDIINSSIISAKIYPQLAFCSIDLPHKRTVINVDLVGRGAKYPYIEYYGLLATLLCIFLIVIIIVILFRCNKHKR